MNELKKTLNPLENVIQKIIFIHNKISLIQNPNRNKIK